MIPSTVKSGDEKILAYLPPIGEPVWVQCEGFRCMAILGIDGIWKDFFNHEELTGVIKVLVSSFS